MVDGSFADKTRRLLARILVGLGTVLVVAGRTVAYPFHVSFRIGSRLCLLLATVMSIALTLPLAPLAAYRAVHGIDAAPAWQPFGWPLAEFLDDEAWQFAALFVSLGLAGAALKAMGSAAWERAKELGKMVVEAAEGEWRPRYKREGCRLPNLKVVDSLKTTWRNYLRTIPGAAAKSFRSSMKMIGCLFAIAAVLAVAWHVQKRTVPVSQAISELVVMEAHEAQPPEPEELRTYLRAGAVFSLMHMDNAKLSTPNSGMGICLDGAKLEWLKSFRKAVKDCIDHSSDEELACEGGTERCPVLKVTGFASIAPEQSDASSTCNTPGKTFNCKVANLRARAVGAFLAEGEESEWMCPESGAFNGANKCSPDLCSGEDLHMEVSGNGSNGSIGIAVEQWASDRQMCKGKPANDGEPPDHRRYRVEMLNRAVHIEVRRDFCTVPGSAA